MARQKEIERYKHMTRELMGFIGEQRLEIDALKRQTYEMSEAVRSKQAVIDGFEWQVQELEEQNESLKELVQILYPYAEIPYDCESECPHSDYCKEHKFCWIEDTISKLGLKWSYD